MGYFLTSKSRIEQTDTNGYWKLIDNELYMDDQNRISITPRRFWSDSYTFPLMLVAFLGDRFGLDVRPAHGHDICCRFHERIYVNLSLAQLRIKGYLKTHPEKDIIICEDIPLQYLSIEPISKTKTDNLLKEMMLSCGIKKSICNQVRFGVFFNINWWLKTGKKSLTSYNIYEEDIGLVNGV